MLRAVLAVVIAGTACSGKPSRSGDGAARAGDDAAPAPGRRDLLAHVPEDTMFVLAVRDDMPAPASQRILRDVGPVIDRLAAVARDELAVGGVDAEQRLALGLVAELAGTGLLRPRAVIYDLRGVTVLRVATDKPAELAAAVGRAGDKPPLPGASAVSFDVRGPDDAIHVAVRDSELVIASGPPPVMAAMYDVLDGKVPLPAPALAADALDRLAATHALSPSAVGYIDVARLGDRLRAAPAALAALGLDLPPTDACADAVATLLGRIPRVALGARAMTAEKLELVAEIAIDPAKLATLRAAQRPVAGLPIGGNPLIGFALAGTGEGGDPAWREELLPIVGRCKPEAALAIMASPASGVRGVAAVIYDGTMEGFLPSAIDGYVAVTADDLVDVLKGARSAGLGNVRVPADGKPFAKLSVSGTLKAVLSSAAIARRGDTLVIASGPVGRAQAEATFAASAPPPFLQVVVDIGRFDRWKPASATSASPSDADRVRAGSSLLADAGWNEARRALLTALAITIETNARGIAGRVELGLGPPGDVDPPPPAPSREVRECRRILDRAWTAAEPALARLGVTAELAEIESTYRTGLDTLEFAKSCVTLDATARGCVLQAPDPLVGAARCLASSASFELPQLFSFFGPHPLDDRWRDRRRVPVPDENAFLVPTQEGWLVRDAAGCAAITTEGLVMPATCAFADRDGDRWLDVTYDRPCPPLPSGTCPVTLHLRKTGETLDTSP